MSDIWQKPDFEEVAVNVECTAYSGVVLGQEGGTQAGGSAPMARAAEPSGESASAADAHSR
jgi:hypothetical protein